MLETSERPTFEEVELDDDILTPEEYSEFTSSCHREHTFGFPRGSLTSSQFDGARDFDFHSDRRLGSPRSEDSDSSYLSVKTDKSSAGDGSGSKSAKSGKTWGDPLTSEEAKHAISISGLSQLPANSWNKFSHNVFRNFKVNTFIVQPNYFLCASKSKSRSQVEEINIQSGYTIDRILDSIHSQGSGFLQWSAIEPDVDRLLTAYDDLKGLPIELGDIEKSTTMIRNFIITLNRSQGLRELPGESSLDHVSLWLVRFAKKLKVAVETQHFKEDLSEEYIMALIMFFEQLIGGSKLICRQKESISLDLEDAITGQGKVMNIQPDIFVYYNCAHFLVGEVKPHRFSKKKEHKPQAESSLDKVLHKTDWGGKVEIPCPTCDSVFLSEEDAKEHFKGVQHAKRIKLVDEEIPCTAEEGKESPIKAGGDANTSDRATKPEEMSNLPCNMPDATGEEKNSKHFRHLKEEEKFIVKRYLPELLAEMLACMDANTRNIDLGRDNERNQLGFAVDGFKLKLVRLVLRNTRRLKEKPTVSNIRNADVRCDVFMTEDFNLFNKRHLKMLFKMLFTLLFTFKIGIL